MRKTSLLLLVVLLAAALPALGAIYYSQNNDAVGNLANWNTARDGSGSAPGAIGAGDTLVVQGGDSLWLAAAQTAGMLDVENGGKMDASTFVWTLTDFYLRAGAEFIQGGAVQAVPGTNRSFDAASTYRFNGTQAGTTNASYPEFGNLVWEPTASGSGTFQNQNTAPPYNGGLVVRGDFTINIQGATKREVRFATGTSINREHIIDGDLIINSNSSKVVVANGGSGAGTMGTLYIGGDLVINDGVFQGLSSTAANGGTARVYLYGNLANNGDSMNIGASTIGSYAFRFDGTGTVNADPGAVNAFQALAIPGSTTVNLLDDMTVNTGPGQAFFVSGTLNCGTHVIAGTSGINAYGPATLGLGHAGGLDSNIALSGSCYYDSAVNYVYNGTVPQVTGNSLPDSVNDLTVDNAAGLTMSKGISAFGTVNLVNGIVSTGSNWLGSYNQPVRTNGYVDGHLGIWVPAGNQTITYDLGTANGYSPAVVDFINVTTPNGVGGTAVQSTHSDVSTPENTMQRYWEIGSNPATPLGFDSCRINLTYLAADFNTGFAEAADEATMVVGKRDSTGWTFPEIAVRTPGGAADGGSIQISNLTSLSQFTMAKDQASIAAPPDTTPPTIVSVSPAYGATGVALDEPITVAFSEPMNTGSVDGYPSGNSFTLGWNAGGDTLTLTPQYSYQYNTVYWIIVTAGTDLAGNPLPVLPDTVALFTTIANQGPVITMVQQPGDTYDGSGPFAVRAVITDPAKAGIAADTLWYTDNAANWWSLSHASIEGDTFSYSIAGPFVPGTIIEYFFGAWDDAGAVQYDPSMYRGYQFRILDPLPPTTLSATGLDMAVDLSWAPPAQVIGYSNWAPAWYYYWGGGDIATTRFSPQHYPCRLEQAVAMFYDAGSGMDSVEVHVWADNGEGLPDLLTELVPPFRVMPEVYPTATVVDLSGYNLVLAGGDFHVGYVCLYESKSNPLTDGGGSGVRSIFHDALMGTWGNLIIGGDYCNWLHQAVVTYSSYTKGLALKSYKPRKTDKPLPATTGLKAVPVVNKRAPVYPKLTGALAMAKYCNGYTILRGDAPGGPYSAIGSSGNPPSYLDDAVTNGSQYYYVVRAEYSTPDTFSANSNEATATAAALPILLVDDDGSWNGFVDVQTEYTAALDAAGQSGNYTVFDAQFDGDGPDSVWISGRTHVIWATGETYGDGDDSTLTPANEAVLAAFLNAGGRLFLSAQDYLYDAYNSAGYFTAGQFPYDYLGLDSAAQDFTEDAYFNIAGVGLSLADGQSFTVDTSPVYMYPDDLTRLPAALDVFDVTAKVGEKPAVQYGNGTFRTVFFAFPFENITEVASPNTQGELMARILSWLTTGVEGNPAVLSKPASYSLAANYPNPVRGRTTVKYALPRAGNVRIAVYNVAGQKVKTLVDGTMNAGYHSVSW
ncbi:MAG: Ig-like domain-containing protein, partial [Candidatus Edwardsbacteria bacterium]|nr:Ig-like domain-containing protein [Candidatus Edwardsbacteria bacterium]